MRRSDVPGFTLIELLIVVAIIAILAAIAVPNFLEAQVRAKVSRTKSDMRALRTAMEAYHVDHNRYVPDYINQDPFDEVVNWAQLTTPIAYVTSIFWSPFELRDGRHHNPYGAQEPYVYWGGHWEEPLGRAEAGDLKFMVVCCGPDQDLDFGYGGMAGESPGFYFQAMLDAAPAGFAGIYDPTNGTRSNGDILMSARGLHN
ncbi:MAG TPA: prepilin-type N-terminal cleavage/methylation domain-containing protein [Sumerlaeia bacterium]|nr:prepilin-type N-terminal cleavage/methylation domain-containing protein [Sumerlaeia bacterium]